MTKAWEDKPSCVIPIVTARPYYILYLAASGQLLLQVRMFTPTFSLMIQRRICYIHPPVKLISGNITCLPATSHHLFKNKIYWLRASISTTRKAALPQSTRASYNLFRTTSSCLSSTRLVFSTSTSGPKMSTDDDYMNFLNKANEDPSADSAKAQTSPRGKKELKAADYGVDIPQTLVTATKDAFYVSDSDEPFVPVSLAWEKGEGLPDEGKSYQYSLYNLLRIVSSRKANASYLNRGHSQVGRALGSCERRGRDLGSYRLGQERTIRRHCGRRTKSRQRK